VGTWVVDEVRLAVDKGYRLIKVYEFYEYDVTQFDPATGEGGLFVQYINTFLKLKAEASGYPKTKTVLFKSLMTAKTSF
jgi:hypothetical protein